MSKPIDPSVYADHDAPITMLSLRDKYFPLLSETEQKYAHFMAKASFAGIRIVLRQVSFESEPIFDLIVRIHRTLNGEYPKGESEIEQTALYLDYVSQFLANLGNYKSFGDSKFIPQCEQQFVLKLCSLANIDVKQPIATICKYGDDGDERVYDYDPQCSIEQLIANGMYGVTDENLLLGFPAEGHVSSYYLGDHKVSLEDMNTLKEYLFAKHGFMAVNVRIKKLAEHKFEILVASETLRNMFETIYPAGELTLDDPANTVVCFKFGDHSREMKLIAKYLREAQKYVANETEYDMLAQYIKHFETGSGPAHKESQKLWVRDISPAVETNIGFIETYREPSGVIGEFEALVSIQNKERTRKFGALVNNAEEFIKLLPWDATFEKPKFNPPDFTSLEVLSFVGSGIPAGINIPNYDDVRINIGFKNVSLGNILAASSKPSKKHPPSFIKKEEREMFQKYQPESFEVQVGIHELLGHGSGKLLLQTGPEEYNFDIQNPPLGLDGQPVSTFYKLGETWGGVFGSLAGPFEETRAEVVAMYLISNRDLLKIFGYHDSAEQDNIIYAGYLQMARAGLMALEFWDPVTKKWGQPHMQARFSIMKTFLKHCSNENFLTIREITNPEDGKPDLELSLDRSLIETAGRACVEDYLRHLHIYKCSADFTNGSKYYIDRSTVTPELAAWRDIVLSKRLPRRQYISGNTTIDPVTGAVELHEYEETPLGMLQSFMEREF